MPRKARITIPGAVHHIMSRGIEGCRIFRDDNDRHYFKAVLEINLTKAGYLLYAWCLMDNHYHLVIRINEYPLGQFMRMVNGPYAQYFRKNTNMRGYLFQDRYKSVATQDPYYIEELVRYVHLNPIRAGLYSDLDGLLKYPWCGHSVLMGDNEWSIQNCRDVLHRFDTNTLKAREKYVRFLEDGLTNEPNFYKTIRVSNDTVESIHNTACWVIGNKEFVRDALEKYQQNRKLVEGYAKEGINVHSIAEEVCKLFGLDCDEIKRRRRNCLQARIRKVICFIANRKYRIPTGVIAGYFEINSSSVSNMVSKGEMIAREMGVNY